MMLVSMVMTLLFIMFMVVGVDATNLWNWLWVVGGVVAFSILFYIGVGKLIENAAPSMYSQKRFFLAARRRIVGGSALRSDEEIALDKLADAELERHLERNPNDALAVEIYCERLKKAGRTADYARELEYLLAIPNKLTVEERCSRLNELADLALSLNNPDKAREMLNRLIEEHPRHYQATLARRRLAQLAGTAPPLQGYSPEDFDTSRIGRR